VRVGLEEGNSESWTLCGATVFLPLVAFVGLGGGTGFGFET
jgi:hypothetical protein